MQNLKSMYLYYLPSFSFGKEVGDFLQQYRTQNYRGKHLLRSGGHQSVRKNNSFVLFCVFKVTQIPKSLIYYFLVSSFETKKWFDEYRHVCLAMVVFFFLIRIELVHSDGSVAWNLGFGYWKSSGKMGLTQVEQSFFNFW